MTSEEPRIYIMHIAHSLEEGDRLQIEYGNKMIGQFIYADNKKSVIKKLFEIFSV